MGFFFKVLSSFILRLSDGKHLTYITVIVLVFKANESFDTVRAYTLCV